MWNFNYDSPKEISQILDLASLAMTKKFGQNFLYSASAREHIVRALNAQEGACVWEIGPGLGSITSLLLKSGVKVRAFEIDNGFCRLLREQAFADENNFSLVQGDALKTLFTQDETPDYICGNLPYNVGSVCIAKLIENDIRVRRMVFYPQPNVDSAVVVMERRETSLVPDEMRNDFLSIVRMLFSQRRKTIRNNLSSAYSKDKLSSAFDRASLSGMERAEALDIDQLINLVNILKSE